MFSAVHMCKRSLRWLQRPEPHILDTPTYFVCVCRRRSVHAQKTDIWSSPTLFSLQVLINSLLNSESNSVSLHITELYKKVLTGLWKRDLLPPSPEVLPPRRGFEHVNCQREGPEDYPFQVPHAVYD
jgi:hypothetical protein